MMELLLMMMAVSLLFLIWKNDNGNPSTVKPLKQAESKNHWVALTLGVLMPCSCKQVSW